jgi:uncharacterized membrane protein
MFTEEAVYALLRLLHIAAGGLALVAGPGAMLTRKGALHHRRWGKTFFWGMAVITGTGLLMSLMNTLAFLFMVSVFSFYLCFAGYRALYARKPGQSARWPDYTVALLALVAAAGFFGWSLHTTDDLRIVARLFGGILAALSLADLFRFIAPSSDRMAWRYAHMVRFLAAYIATFTAFAVVNLQFLPPLLLWLAPTVAGTVGITAWVIYYKLRDARAGKGVAAAA